MRGSGFQSGAARLQEAYKNLQEAWLRTREHWADENAEAFEEIHLRIISEEVAHVLPAISQMSQTIGTAVRECEE